MTHRFFRIALALLICVSIPVTASAQIVDIPDANLRAAIETELGKASGDTITAADMATLTWLDFGGANISDLTGLEGATNLTALDLIGNNISDISAISGLTNLESLNLGRNRILDISAVSGLTNLTSLWLYGNDISDISVVSGLTNLTGLYLQNNDISDISVVSGLTNLSVLSLDHNDISDSSPVAGLTHLRFLYLGSNNISDISVVSGLTNLTYLDLSANDISDISAIAGLTNLTYLGLYGNDISDISAIAGLTNLTKLRLWGNDISDISVIAGLTNLTELHLWGNTISDLSPLAANTGLGSGDEVAVTKNPLSYASIHTHIPTLQGRGVTVYFDPQASLTLLKISGDNQTRPVGAVLTNSFVVEVQDENGTAQAGIAVTFTVTAGGGMLSATNTTTDANGRAESTLTLGPSLGANTVSVAAEGSESQVTFNANAVARDGVDIPDTNLRAKIEEALGKAAGDPITAADMATLTTLRARDVSIGDLTGLEAATNLTELYLSENSISDLSPLAGLPNLRELWLQNNNISDISVLSGLTNLTWLTLGANSTLDISVLSGLTNLTELDLSSSNISDLLPLAGLPALRYLHLRDNNISDLSPLADLTNLTDLYLLENSISDLLPLAGLPALRYLYLRNNNISDLSPLAANTGLGSGDRVYVTNNPLSYASIHTHIPTLQGREVTVYFSDQAHPALVKVSGDNQKGGAGAALASPFVVEVQDENGTAQAGIAVTFTVTAGGGTLSATNTTTDANGRAESTLTLGPSLGANTVSVAADSIESQVTFYANAVARDAVDIPDANLRAAVEEALGKASGDTITAADMATLTTLVAINADIRDLTGLEGATNLTELDLSGNWRVSDISLLTDLANLTHLRFGKGGISDLSAISGLTKLTELILFGNPRISDISPVAGLTNLTELDLSGNPRISDISPVSGLTNLTKLRLSGRYSWMQATTSSKNDISDISPVSGLTNLTELDLSASSISDISAVSGLINLTTLSIGNNSISDISAVSGLTSLTELDLNFNDISDISPVSGLTNLTTLDFSSNDISDISGVSNLTNLTELDLSDNDMSDLSPMSGLTNLTDLNLGTNSISDISAILGLANLTKLILFGNDMSDPSLVSGLTNVTDLNLGANSISDISAVSNLTNLTVLILDFNNISDISPMLGLTNLTVLALLGSDLSYASIHTHIPTLQGRGVTVYFSDQAHPALLKVSGDNQKGGAGAALASPFVVEVQDENGAALVGVSVTFTVTKGGGTLRATNTTTDANGRAESTLTLGADAGPNTVAVVADGIEGQVIFNAIADTFPTQFLWSIPADMSLIHVPLQVTTVDGVAQTITSIADLYDALGGASTVNFLITQDATTQTWHSYLGDISRGTTADRRLTDDIGIIANMRAPVTLRLGGNPLGTDGASTITLNQGVNLVGLPLRDSRISRVSDLLTLEGIGGNVPVVILTDEGEFKAVGRAGDPGDIPITGGQSFILNAQAAATVAISGEGWYNPSSTLAGPSIAIRGVEVTDTTPVLALSGSIVDEASGLQVEGFRVAVKNLSTGRAVSTEHRSREARMLPDGIGTGGTASAFPTVTGDKQGGYQLTVVDVETGRAAMIGDILEISVHSPHPLIGVQPLRYTVTTEDVLRSRIELPVLVAYEIPAETALLPNYPNPFNPETWIPYRLAEDAFVTLTIYDLSGQVVRTLEVGHRMASAYETRSKAIYWDGRNQLGEPVASGVYYYHLSAGDYAATRKMLIVK